MNGRRGTPYGLTVATREMLKALVNGKVVTEHELTKVMSLDRTGVRHHYMALVTGGFNVRRRDVSLVKKHRKKFAHGIKPVETVYYI